MHLLVLFCRWLQSELSELEAALAAAQARVEAGESARSALAQEVARAKGDLQEALAQLQAGQGREAGLAEARRALEKKVGGCLSKNLQAAAMCLAGCRQPPPFHNTSLCWQVPVFTPLPPDPSSPCPMWWLPANRCRGQVQGARGICGRTATRQVAGRGAAGSCGSGEDLAQGPCLQRGFASWKGRPCSCLQQEVLGCGDSWKYGEALALA